MNDARHASGLVIALLLCAAPLAAESENDWFVPLGPPPKASPERISGGEGVPPLPLPATPLRRSERKRQPSAPPLIGKLVWGEAASYRYDTGATADISDWNLCPGDVQAIVGKAQRMLGTAYGYEQVSLATFDDDPTRLPLLFVSGVRTIRFSQDQVARLRAYVQRGGMVVFDSVAGSPYFTDAARAFADAAFPDAPLRTVPEDHPLYHMLTDVTTVGFGRNAPGDRPHMEAVYVGSRCGVLISPYGLGTGWDDHGVASIEQAVFYDVDAASRLGLNLVAYAVGYAAVGQAEGRPELFGALDERRPANEFVFAQVRHGGHWDAHPGAAVALLGRVAADTSVATSRKRVAVVPGRDDLEPYPVLFMTGLDDPRFDDKARAALRAFIVRGGTLIVDNALGLGGFDAAFRRELASILPGSALQPIPPDHPLFSAAVPVREAIYTPLVTHEHPDLTAPRLEGLAVEGELRVIYSPYDLHAGWAGVECPMSRGFSPETASALGLDLIVYALTH